MTRVSCDPEGSNTSPGISPFLPPPYLAAKTRSPSAAFLRPVLQVLFLSLVAAGCSHIELNLPSINQRGEVALALKADGTYRLLPEEPGEIYVTNLEGSFLRRVTESGSCHGFVSWSPDAASLLYTEFACDKPERFALKIATASGRDQRTLVETGEDIFLPTWSPDGGSVLYALNAGDYPDFRLHLVRLEDGRVRQLTEEGNYSQFVWSRDGKAVYTLKTEPDLPGWPDEVRAGSLRRIEIESGWHDVLAVGMFGLWGRLALSLDGNDLVFAALPSPVLADDLDGMSSQSLFRMHLPANTLDVAFAGEKQVALPLFSRDNRYLVFITFDEEKELTRLVKQTLDGAPPETLAERKENGILPIWASESRVVYVETGDRADEGDSILILNLAEGTGLDLTEKLGTLMKAVPP